MHGNRLRLYKLLWFARLHERLHHRLRLDMHFVRTRVCACARPCVRIIGACVRAPSPRKAQTTGYVTITISRADCIAKSCTQADKDAIVAAASNPAFPATLVCASGAIPLSGGAIAGAAHNHTHKHTRSYTHTHIYTHTYRSAVCREPCRVFSRCARRHRYRRRPYQKHVGLVIWIKRRKT